LFSLKRIIPTKGTKKKKTKKKKKKKKVIKKIMALNQTRNVMIFSQGETTPTLVPSPSSMRP